jgi:ATP-dependent exoDNAse (exonuclease V) alpha subunit
LYNLTTIPDFEVLFQAYQSELQRLDRAGQILFLTGKAGTGKSTLLRLYTMLHPTDTIVLAPTGIAAVNCGGVTIHSFFGLPFRPLTIGDHEIKKYGKNHPKNKLINKANTFIIDEISMVRADILDAIDYSLRVNTGNLHEPFGGKRMIFIGDLFQLEPVVKNNTVEYLMFNEFYKTPYFFSARALDKVQMEMMELTKIYRQQDPYFIGMLDNIRSNEIESEDLFNLNQQELKPHEAVDPYTITLTTTNATAQLINDKQLSCLPEPEVLYPAVITGEINKSHVSADEILRLRIGAQVVFLKNDPNKRWVNGTIGRVVQCDREMIKVLLENGTEHEVMPAEWENNIYSWDEKNHRIKSETIGIFRQIPVKAAWAITIHKSQGLTFERLRIDLGKGTFAHGQLYVALSRAKSLEGLKLNRPVRYKDVIVDERVIEFMSEMRRNRV